MGDDIILGTEMGLDIGIQFISNFLWELKTLTRILPEKASTITMEDNTEEVRWLI